jgi:hypothetical protein
MLFVIKARLPATERVWAEGAPHFEDDIRASLETITADKCVNFYGMR